MAQLFSLGSMTTPTKIAVVVILLLLIGAVVFYFSARSTIQLMQTDYIVDFRDWSRIKIQRAGTRKVAVFDRAGLAAKLLQASPDAKRKTILIRYVGEDDFFYMPQHPIVAEVEAVARAAGFTTILSSAPAPGNRQQAFFERLPDNPTPP